MAEPSTFPFDKLTGELFQITSVGPRPLSDEVVEKLLDLYAEQTYRALRSEGRESQVRFAKLFNQLWDAAREWDRWRAEHQRPAAPARQRRAS